ncbi:hypothetical protein KM043_009578 [Ampulex compressa]|nr:hypothetical protein KM043_009578 [Ampulex compressa]
MQIFILLNPMISCAAISKMAQPLILHVKKWPAGGLRYRQEAPQVSSNPFATIVPPCIAEGQTFGHNWRRSYCRLADARRHRTPRLALSSTELRESARGKQSSPIHRHEQPGAHTRAAVGAHTRVDLAWLQPS